MIRPVEMNGAIQRVQDITQIKQNADSKPQLDQANIQSHVEKEIKHKQEQVVEQKNAESKDEKHDAREKGKGEYFEQNFSGKRKKKENPDGEVKTKTSGGFDVKI